MVDRVLFIPDKLNTLDGYRLLFSSIMLWDILSYKVLRVQILATTDERLKLPDRAKYTPPVVQSHLQLTVAREEVPPCAKRLFRARNVCMLSRKQTRSRIRDVEQTDGYAAADPGHVGLDHADVGVLRRPNHH